VGGGGVLLSVAEGAVCVLEFGAWIVGVGGVLERWCGGSRTVQAVGRQLKPAWVKSLCAEA